MGPQFRQLATTRATALYDEGPDGSGKTIAIVDSFGYPQAAADLEQFSKDYGLPLMCGMPGVACQDGMGRFSTLTFGNHQVKRARANHSPGQEASNAWSVEVALDIEYAHTRRASVRPRARSARPSRWRTCGTRSRPGPRRG